MENQTQKNMNEEHVPERKDLVLPATIVVSAAVVIGAWAYVRGPIIAAPIQSKSVAAPEKTTPSTLEESVMPSRGVILHVKWGDLGAKLVSVGAIDADKFAALYAERGVFSGEYKNLLIGQNNANLKITKDNAGYLLNLFWALGLASKNPILDSGEIKNPAYGGADHFASTAGWTMAKGDPMDHFSRHMFFNLTPGEQALVEKVSSGIYRPCCGNSAHFPDCNHGMAMLGLLELMASQGASEQDMWKAALAVNSYWFPDTYHTIARYFESRGMNWSAVNPREVLGSAYSSDEGIARIRSLLAPEPSTQPQGGCGVDSGTPQPVQPQKQPASPERERGEQSGCGV